MDLTYLLTRKGVDTKTARILVMRHVPPDPGLRKALPWLAAGEPMYSMHINSRKVARSKSN